MTTWPWPPGLDAVRAAPESHSVVLENEVVRVLRVAIRPGSREPLHTHRWPSVMLIEHPARIRYYDVSGRLVFEKSATETEASRAVQWLDAEPPHSVENIDDRPYQALRIEVKSGCATKRL